MKKKTYIGGEFYWKPSIFFRKKNFDLNEYLKKKYPQKQFTFTGGGFYSLFRIIDDLNFKKEEEILFPSYLCPTILIPFRKRNIQYRFFKVDKKLEIDIDDIKSKITENTKAVFFINYFGFPPNQEKKEFLKKLKKKGIIIIEDMVQSFFSDIELIGDYAFNSFRKFLPVDGSVIISDKLLKKKEYPTTTKYNLYKFIGQFLRYLTVEHQMIDFSKYFLKLLVKANDEYYRHESVSTNYLNKLFLTKIDVDNLINFYRKNFTTLLKSFSIIAVFKKLDKDTVPLGFPVLIKERDKKRKQLMQKNIFCPIHWRLAEEMIRDEFLESSTFSEKILTIPLSRELSRDTLQLIKDVLEV